MHLNFPRWFMPASLMVPRAGSGTGLVDDLVFPGWPNGGTQVHRAAVQENRTGKFRVERLCQTCSGVLVRVEALKLHTN